LLRIAVINSGSYIPPTEQPRVFDRFHQLAGSSRTGGSGIGLALVKELVTLLGGAITVSSDPHTGTCFDVELPILLTAPPGARETAASTAGAIAAAAVAEQDLGDDLELPEPEGAAATILVVEDNNDLRGFVVRELAADYRVLEAPDGEQGLAAALEHVPDLVVSDVMMPGIDGFELCRRLKGDLSTSHVPVILLTARVELESRLEGLEQGADDYLAKPFDARELRVRIANLVAMRRKLQARYASQVVTLDLEAMPVTSADERFLHRCRAVVEEHLDNEDFTVETFAREVGLSRAQLHRKLKALIDLAPRDFLRTQRLQRAAHLLRSRYGNVTEVAYAVGFKSLSHFARSFREQFGVSPSSYPDGD
jgi:DNA-binding response OmpR family regulator